MEQFELPANIKQIGTIGDGPRIYLEDYAYTYLAQYAESGGYNERLAFLVGRRIVIDGAPVLFVSAAAAGKFCDVRNGLTVFTEKSMAYAEEAVKQYFPGLSVVGWMQSQPGYGSDLGAPYLQYHLDNFREQDQVLFVMDPIEKVNAFYVRGEDGLSLKEAGGYFIYYDKNRAMHEYMLDNKAPEPRVKTRAEPALDPAAYARTKPMASEPKVSEPRFLTDTRATRSSAAHHRSGMDQRRLMNLAISLCAVLFIVCFIMGAGLIQNQDRITGMERQIVELSTAYRNLVVQASQDGAAQAYASQDQAQNPSGDNADLIVEDGANAVSGQSRNTASQSESPLTQGTDGAAQNPDGAQTAVGQAAGGAQTDQGDGSSQAGSANGQSGDQTASAGQNGDQTASAGQSGQAAEALSFPLSYTVQDGDSLSSISRKFYGNTDMVRKIMDANGIKNADYIYRGEKLVLPAK
ncbi:MAG: LysM peptidoglycan-binding domain-containing protein [Firmicutes bacterium]|nr:LysM peptidoglycan-binding domain-containing protein [Bacillota bacterium]